MINKFEKLLSSDKALRNGKNAIAISSFSSTFLVTIGAILISFSPVFVKISTVGPTLAGFYRTLIGGLVLLIIALIKQEKLWRGQRQLLLSSVAALLFALGLTFWHRSIISIGPGPSTILSNFQVFFLAGIGVFLLKERIGMRLAISIPLAILGITLLVGVERFGASLDYRTGVVFGLSAAFVYALYVIVLKKLQTGETTSAQLSNFAAVSLICAVIMGLEGFIQGESFSIPDIQSMICMLAYGVLSQAIGWILISAGLPYMEASRAGILLLLQPTGAFLWDILIFHRQTTGIEFLGAAIALIAIYIGGMKTKH